MTGIEIFGKRVKIGMLSQDYGHTVDDILHIESANELDTIEKELHGYRELKKLVTPTKVVKDFYGQPHCPNCNSISIEAYYEYNDFSRKLNYCDDCGQKLDWSLT